MSDVIGLTAVLPARVDELLLTINRSVLDTRVSVCARSGVTGRRTEPTVGALAAAADRSFDELALIELEPLASRTLTETTWNATILQGDVADAVAALKEQPGRDLL